jgi:hypothetical protein
MIIGGETLYHASYTVVERIDLSQCRKRNDFGSGFYLTTDRAQAVRFVKTAVRKKGLDSSKGFVNSYECGRLDDIHVYEFATTDREWLHCVCEHRRFGKRQNARAGSGIDRWKAYDILAGKIANDDTMTVINVYLAGGYGDYGSESAINMAISLLKPERLKDQVCFRTARAVERLAFKGSFEVTI